MSQPNQPTWQTNPARGDAFNSPTRPISPPPVSPGRPTVVGPPPQVTVLRKQRSLFATGFIVTMGVMVAVTVWFVVWGLATGLIIAVLAALGNA